MAGRVQLIVGLGNPGSEYERTRHNAGFWFVEELARKYMGQFKPEKKFHGEVAKITVNGNDVWLLKPDTFMNNSGQAIQALANFYKIPVEEILVAHDELDLPPGTTRLKKGGGHGGHNGLRDTINRMGKEFQRLRIGIGHPGDKNKVSGFVLKKATQDEQIDIDRSIDKALDAMRDVFAGDMQRAMNDLHSSN